MGDPIPKSQIPSIRWMTEADQPALEKLYGRMCPGRATNLRADCNDVGVVVERDGKIVAALVGTRVTVAQVLLLAEPEDVSSESAAHDVNAAADAVIGVMRSGVPANAVVGAIVFAPASLRTLGEALDRTGFLSVTDKFSAHVALVVGPPDEPAPQTN